MPHSTSQIIRVYARLLRLYPRGFRADYAGEMEAVFRQAVEESEGAGVGLLLSELRDLPLSLIQAHLRERRQYQLAGDGGGIMLQRLYSPRLFQFCAYTILALFVLYALSVVTAYFTFDLRTHSLQNAYQWWYAVGNDPSFIGNRLPIGLFLLFFYLLLPPSMLLSGGILSFNLWRRWYRLSLRQRRLGVLALLVILLMLLLTVFTLVWDIGGLWFYD